MDIMELRAPEELVGGVAVVAPLISVGLQVRQNTRAVQSTTHSQMLDDTTNIARLLIGKTEIPSSADSAADGREA